jgi:flagellar biosynthetic protein FliO
LAKIDPQKRRQVIILTIVLSTALLGFVLITMQQSGEHASLFATPAMAAGTGDTLSTTPPAAPAYEGAVGKAVATVSILKMILALAAVIACIYVGIFILKKMTGQKKIKGGGTSILEVIETAHLDPKKSLSLVRVADRSVLIGVTDSQITVLTEIDSDQTSELLTAAQKRPQEDAFGMLLKSASDRFKGLSMRKDSSQQ